MKTKIHVNQHHIRSNKTKKTDLPVITIKQVFQLEDDVVFEKDLINNNDQPLVDHCI